ncbi:helix-turn-helix domain-containing protein [Actinomycetospora sp. NBRC 106375]|uniref:helix-turn-helix domain-containing protein n=1 Tax=Actinomycetospora sp. NBRC 106375 TaxID=3032207 RepID=UPI0033287004
MPPPRWRALLLEGRSHPEVARLCGVSVRTVERWAAQLRRDHGHRCGGGAG